MKRGKLEFVWSYYFDHTTMEQHFEKMAGKGWALDRMGIFWHYHRIEPKPLHYAVGYFPGGGVYAPPTGEELTFEEYCEMAGWELAAEHGPMKIFCNERENPVPLETQADLQVENIRRGSRRIRIADGVVGVIGWLIVIYFILSLYFDGVRTLSGGTGLTLTFMGLMLGIYGVVEFITYQRWYRKAKVNAQRDQSFTPTKGHPAASKIIIWLTIAAAIFYASTAGKILVLLILVGYWIVYYLQDIIRNGMRDKGISTVVNIGINFGIAFFIFFFVINGYRHLLSSDAEDYYGNYYENYYEKNGFHWDGQENPLTLQELAGPEFDGQGYIDTQNIQSSVFLSRMEIEQFYDEVLSGAGGDPGYYLEYVVAKVKLEPLYGFIRSSMERTYGSGENWKSMDSWKKGEKGVLQIRQTEFSRKGQKIYRYLICMKDRIVKIDLSFAPDKVQQEKIVETLGKI